MIEPYGVYTTDELAFMLHVTKITVLGYIKRKKIKAVKLGKGYRILGQSLIDYLRR